VSLAVVDDVDDDVDDDALYCFRSPSFISLSFLRTFPISGGFAHRFLIYQIFSSLSLGVSSFFFPFLLMASSKGAAALDLGRLNALNLDALNALADLHRAGADSPPTPPLHPDDFAHVMRYVC